MYNLCIFKINNTNVLRLLSKDEVSKQIKQLSLYSNFFC